LSNVIPIAASVWLLVASPLLAERARAADSAAAEREFRRGLAALHEFEYEDANDDFREAQKRDPSYVMPFWGEALTYHQILWRHENVDQARLVLGRLGPTPSARAARCRTPKERDLLSAVEILFGRGDSTSRRREYADAMGRAHERYPDDPDVASLYALAVLGTMSRGLMGATDAHEGHSEGLAGSTTQTRVAAILEGVLKVHPDHAGALHYLIHTYDDPAHATLALGAARRYTRAATSSHARHMPAHIFLQLGLWDEAAASDQAAYDASVEWTTRRSRSAALRNYHALSWLEYELLQLGRYRDAEQTMRPLEPLATRGDNVILLNDLSSMRARFVVETERWSLLAGQNTFANVNDLFAVGLSVAHLGRGTDAEHVRSLLAQRAQAKAEGDLRPAIAIMERELAAALASAAGRTDDEIAILTSAARAELELPAPLGLPQPIKPAAEMLGETLSKAGRPADAIEWFERALKRNANRSRSVVGLARALAAVGRTDDARRRYTELLANFEHADADRPEVNEARAALQPGPVVAPADRTRSRLLALALSVATAIGAVLIVRRRRLRRKLAVGRQKRKGRKGR
jgi:tetratricopeptide (TPR) repeat protein